MSIHGPLTVRPISSDQLEQIALEVDGTFAQVPAWGHVKADWTSEYVGWFDRDDTLVGGALVLHRAIPRTKRTLAYTANGPALPWDEVCEDPARWFDPFLEYMRTTGCFTVRVGFPGILQSWNADRAKKAVADDGVLGFTKIPADVEHPDQQRLLRWIEGQGWHRIKPGNPVPVGQPWHICVLQLGGRTEDEVLKGMNQEWRRNIRKAEKAGVEVTKAGPERVAEAMKEFHDVYVETAHRDGFMPRALSYFTAIEESYRASERCDAALYEARADGRLLASAVMVTVGHTCSYLYGGSTTANREYRASNALQWRAIRDAMAAGCTGYDFRGFNTTVEGNLPATGLLRFKLGAGAEIQQVLGEYEVVLNKPLHAAYETAMRARLKVNELRARRWARKGAGPKDGA